MFSLDVDKCRTMEPALSFSSSCFLCVGSSKNQQQILLSIEHSAPNCMWGFGVSFFQKSDQHSLIQTLQTFYQWCGFQIFWEANRESLPGLLGNLKKVHMNFLGSTSTNTILVSSSLLLFLKLWNRLKEIFYCFVKVDQKSSCISSGVVFCWTEETWALVSVCMSNMLAWLS